MRFEAADGVLDLRALVEYEAGHIRGSTWLTWQDLPECLNELPAAPATLFLVGSKADIEAASMFLDSKDYRVNGSLAIESEQAMQTWAQTLPGLVVSGADSKTLWSPSELLRDFVGSVDFDPKQLKPRPMALDIGCGGGRDAVFLALQGWQVDAIDQEARVLKRAKQLASKSRAQVRFKCCDLKKAGCFPEVHYDLISVIRYLNRDLFPLIKSQLKPGGYVVFQTFVSGVEAFGSPKNPNFILQEGELAEVFSGFRIIVDKIQTLKDGRPVVSFIAQKPEQL